MLNTSLSTAMYRSHSRTDTRPLLAGDQGPFMCCDPRGRNPNGCVNGGHCFCWHGRCHWGAFRCQHRAFLVPSILPELRRKLSQGIPGRQTASCIAESMTGALCPALRKLISTLSFEERYVGESTPVSFLPARRCRGSIVIIRSTQSRRHLRARLVESSSPGFLQSTFPHIMYLAPYLQELPSNHDGIPVLNGTMLQAPVAGFGTVKL